MSDSLLILKKYFGHNDFRAGQKDVVDAILQGKDVLAVMPTGAGKSVCFQVPALMLEGVTIVVSPLLSLMKDQVTALGQAGVPAAYINSSLTQTQIETVLNRAAQGKYKLIYVAPERLLTTDFLTLSANLNISLLAIDEAHCVSQWGQDFRPNYLMIPQYIQNLSRRPVVAAFTATATPMVKMDIWKLLKLKEPFCITTGFDRPNLFFSVETPSKKTPRLIEFLYEHSAECGIIYCSTRRKVEEITLKLQEAGFSAARYHAGLDDAERKQNQEDFSNDNVQIIVATNAFGMGIDKSNVSFVVHYNMPKNIESYYQEAGRAGRDGSPAHCLLLFGKGDITTAKRFIYYGAQNEMLTEEQRAQIQKQDLKRLDQMVEYCTTDSCLRAYLLRYFGDKAEDTCNMCGNCKTAEEREEAFNEAEFFSIKSPNLYHVVGNYIKQEYGETFDITVQAQKILSAVARAQKLHPNGIGRTALVRMLNGSKEKRQAELGLDKLSTYGIMCDVPRKTLTQYVDYLHELGFLAYTDSYYPTVTLTSAAGHVLFENEKVKCPMSYLPTLLQPEKKKKAKKSKKKKTTVIWEQDTLYNTLKALRFELAKQANIPAYVIFSNATLLDMAKRMPKTKKQMLQVNGVGEMKLEKYGDVFLQAIQTWLKNEEAEG